ncbi:MAG: hypothetical protein JW739_06400 [Opitutales bacterium]|nr:hypothetical protein [Opitutales bacterium]
MEYKQHVITPPAGPLITGRSGLPARKLRTFPAWLETHWFFRAVEVSS